MTAMFRKFIAQVRELVSFGNKARRKVRHRAARPLLAVEHLEDRVLLKGIQFTWLGGVDGKWGDPRPVAGERGAEQGERISKLLFSRDLRRRGGENQPFFKSLSL
jgi:hypothetical protein